MTTPKTNRFAHALLGAAAFCGSTVLVMNAAHAFDCAKAYLGVDYVICSDPRLIASIDDMGQVWQRIKAAAPADQFSALLADQRQWLKGYGTECGLPSKGQPTEQQIAKAAPCVSARINERLKYLAGLDKPAARSASAGYAWKTGFAHGTAEVSIRNDADSVFTVTCRPTRHRAVDLLFDLSAVGHQQRQRFGLHAHHRRHQGTPLPPPEW